MKKYILPLVLFQLLTAAVSRGQMQAGADTVRPGNGILRTGFLRPGQRQYLLFFQRPQQKRSLGFWYWIRDVATGIREGEPVFTVTQHWYGADSGSYREAYSLNRERDFAPLYHSEVVGGKMNAYRWSGEGIWGVDSVEGNTRKGFSLAFAEPNLNWNLDIETFEMLPLGAGRSFLINFYDAGSEPPRYVLYRVTGSEILTLMDGQRVDCWKLYTEGKSPRGEYSETFWIGKETHEFLKEEDKFGGMYRYKVKMPGTVPDLLGS